MPRLYFEHKLMYHPDVLAKFLKEEKFAPIVVEISPSSRCNLKCDFCYTDYVMKPEISPALMDDKLYFKVIKDCADFGVKAITPCGTGEPLLHAKTPEAISYAKQLGLDVSLVTNGVLATKETMESCLGDLTWVRFSTAAGIAKRYAKLHGTTEESFHIMMKNLRDLIKIKKQNNLTTTLGMVYFLFEGCSDEIVPFVTELKRIGVDYVQIKPCGEFRKNKYIYKKDIYRNQDVADKLREVEELNSDNFYCQIKYDRFREFEKLEKDGFKLPTKCWGLLFYANIGSDGKVYTCSGSWYEENCCYGSLENNTLKEIFESKRFKDVFERRSITNVDSCFTSCHCIPMNRYLMELKDLPLHVNFI